jgi:sporulation protein YlmC with PRC-barrel domain
MTLRLKKTAAALLPAVGLSVALTAFAQERADRQDTPGASQQQAQKDNGPAAQALRDMRASKLIGKSVRNAQDENLGKIEDLVIDVNNRRVHYAVLSFGGIAGLGDKLFAYPIGLFRAAPDSDELVLNVDKAKLEQAPGFEAKRAPDWADERNEYRARVDRYFGDTVKIEARPNMQLRRASDLLDANIVDAQRNKIGEVEDIVVSPGNGRVRYVAADFDDAWVQGDKLVMLPMSAFAARSGERDLRIAADREQVRQAPAYAESRWPDLNDRGYRSDLERFFSRLTRGEEDEARADKP